MTAPVHITKRALARIGRRQLADTDAPPFANACDDGFKGDYVEFDDGFELRREKPSIKTQYLSAADIPRVVTHDACLVLLDAEFERVGGE